MANPGRTCGGRRPRRRLKHNSSHPGDPNSAGPIPRQSRHTCPVCQESRVEQRTHGTAGRRSLMSHSASASEAANRWRKVWLTCSLVPWLSPTWRLVMCLSCLRYFNSATSCVSAVDAMLLCFIVIIMIDRPTRVSWFSFGWPSHRGRQANARLPFPFLEYGVPGPAPLSKRHESDGNKSDDSIHACYFALEREKKKEKKMMPVPQRTRLLHRFSKRCALLYV